MLYTELTIGANQYKLRLNTRGVVLLEKQLGCNPIGIFGDGSELPTVTTMVNILHASLQQYHHNISLNDAYDIFDEYLADGKQASDFLSVIIDIYKVSGLIKNDGNQEKN